MINHRNHLEKVIIGAVLLEGKYYKVGHILKSVNFTNHEDFSHRHIWSAIASLYPKAPIDIITVNAVLLKRHGKSYAYHLTGLTSLINRSSHLEYHALLLLQIDITHRVSALVLQSEIQLKSAGKYEMAGYCHDVYMELLAPANDIFEEANAAIQFFHSYKLTDLSDEIKEIMQHISPRVEQIKKVSVFNTLTAHINKVINDSEFGFSQHKNEVGYLLNSAYKILINEPISGSLSEHLKNNL